MTWLTVTEYLYHTCSSLCSVCRNHNQVLFSCITYHWVCSKSNTTGGTSRAGTAHSSGAHVSTNEFCGVLVALSLVFCVIFCRLFLVLLSFSLNFALSLLLRFTTSDHSLLGIEQYNLILLMKHILLLKYHQWNRVQVNY
jgi:hypothetical protein